MKEFYQALLKAFNDNKGFFMTKNLKPIRIIDLYNSQDINPEFSELLKLPALLVSMNIDYSNDTAIMDIGCKLLYEQLRTTSNVNLHIDEALSFFDLAEITDTIIKGISIKEIGKIKLISEGLELDTTVTDVYNLVYQCEYFGNKNTLQKETLQGEFNELETNVDLYAKVL